MTVECSVGINGSAGKDVVPLFRAVAEEDPSLALQEFNPGIFCNR
jgi:hypothetical protein